MAKPMCLKGNVTILYICHIYIYTHIYIYIGDINIPFLHEKTQGKRWVFTGVWNLWVEPPRWLCRRLSFQVFTRMGLRRKLRQMVDRRSSLEGRHPYTPWTAQCLGSREVWWGLILGTSSMNGKHRSYSRWWLFQMFFFKFIFIPVFWGNDLIGPADFLNGWFNHHLDRCF